MKAIFFILIVLLFSVKVQAQEVNEEEFLTKLKDFIPKLESNQKHFQDLKKEVELLKRDISNNKKGMDEFCMSNIVDKKSCQKEKDEFENLKNKHYEFTEILEKVNEQLEIINKEVKATKQIALENQITILKSSLIYETVLLKAYFQDKIVDTLKSEAFCSAMKRSCNEDQYPIKNETIKDEIFKEESSE